MKTLSKILMVTILLMAILVPTVSVTANQNTGPPQQPPDVTSAANGTNRTGVASPWQATQLTKLSVVAPAQMNDLTPSLGSITNQKFGSEKFAAVEGRLIKPLDATRPNVAPFALIAIVISLVAISLGAISLGTIPKDRNRGPADPCKRALRLSASG